MRHLGASVEEMASVEVRRQHLWPDGSCALAVIVQDDVEDGGHVAPRQIAIIETGAYPAQKPAFRVRSEELAELPMTKCEHALDLGTPQSQHDPGCPEVCK